MTVEDWIDGGVAALDPLCVSVGLPFDVDLDAPKGVALWSGSYAAVLLWPVIEDQLAANAVEAEAWFADYLFGEERRRNARVVDGYLLLALSQPVSAALAGAVRSIELSTQICRKHAVWPDADGEWRRLDAVTVLGLPKAVTSASGEPAWPTLDAEAAALWSNIQRSGAKRAAEAEGR